MKNMVNVHPATVPVSVEYRALFEEVGGVTPEIIDVNESFLVLFFNADAYKNFPRFPILKGEIENVSN